MFSESFCIHVPGVLGISDRLFNNFLCLQVVILSASVHMKNAAQGQSYMHSYLNFNIKVHHRKTEDHHIKIPKSFILNNRGLFPLRKIPIR